MKRPYHIAALGALALAIVGCVDRDSQAQGRKTAEIVTDPTQAVVAQPVGQTSLTDTVDLTGSIVANLETQVGPKVGGRLIVVKANDGDSVASGQVLASVESTAQTAQLQQAMAANQQAIAGLRSAQSQLSQATANATLTPGRSTAAVRQAEAAVRSARAQLEKALNGARPQERAQAVAQVDSARVNVENARKELTRIAKLVAEGAIAANRLDQQQTAVSAAEAQYQNATQALSLIQVGTRQEDIAAARAAVAQAQEGLRSAQASKSLDVLLDDQVTSAKAAIASAKAQVQSTEAAVSLAKQNLDDTIVRAPFSGRVQGKPTQVGTVVAAGTPIIHLVGGQGAYFSAQVTQDLVGRIQVGQSVDVSLDTTSRPLPGVVVAISPQASSIGRQFDVRIEVKGPAGSIRPGVFARGTVHVAQVRDAMVVPQTAVVSQGESKVVFIVDGQSAKMVPVKTGLTQGQLIQVTGLPVGANVIVKGQNGLVDGSKIKLSSTVATKGPDGGAKG